MIPGKIIKGPGGAIDLTASGSRVIVTMEHTAKGNSPKILKSCNLPLTGARCVDMIITELAVFEVDRVRGGLTLVELDKNTTLEEVYYDLSALPLTHQLRKKTEASFTVSPNLIPIREA